MDSWLLFPSVKTTPNAGFDHSFTLFSQEQNPVGSEDGFVWRASEEGFYHEWLKFIFMSVSRNRVSVSSVNEKL